MQHSPPQIRKAFGLLFIGVSIAVFAAAVISELSFLNKMPSYYYAIIWISTFGFVFGVSLKKFKKVIPSIRIRMKNSIKWPSSVKVINGLSWAGPFVTIGAFPWIMQYLILLGIGLGNLSTYLFMKRYSGLANPEQVIVAIISLVSIPIAIEIDMSLFATSQDVAVMLSRILIAIAYGAGGAYALFIKEDVNESIKSSFEDSD